MKRRVCAAAPHSGGPARQDWPSPPACRLPDSYGLPMRSELPSASRANCSVSFWMKSSKRAIRARAFQWLLAKHAIRVFGRRRKRLSGVCDFRRVACAESQSARHARRRPRGSPVKAFLRGKTCTAPRFDRASLARAVLPAAPHRWFKSAALFTAVISRHDVVGRRSVPPLPWSSDSSQVCPQTPQDGRFVCRAPPWFRSSLRQYWRSARQAPS